MKALDTNVLVRVLVNDDEAQGLRVRRLFERHDRVLELIRLGRTSSADLSDLLIGLSGRACGCEVTLTFEKRLDRTELFERLEPPPAS